MSISLKLPEIDANPILLAETRPHKIAEFIQHLPYGDPIRAATDLAEELQILNSQKVAYANRLNALELYRPAAMQIYQNLLPHFSEATLPLTKNEQAFADVIYALWQEFALGYKAALIDLQNKILNLSSAKSTATIVQRALHATKEMMLVKFLCYRAPPESMWGELHQLYFCALQQSCEKLIVLDNIHPRNESSVNLVYAQTMLMAMANPSHLSNQNILRTDAYLAKVADLVELRGLGLIDNPTGVFMIRLNGNKPPVAFSKNRDLPNPATDILLLTLNLARRIHQHIKTLENGAVPEDGTLPSNAVNQNYLDLLRQLIKYFGKTPQRVFSRSKKTDGVEMNIGIDAIHHGINKAAGTSIVGVVAIPRPSRWQILNASATGYALRKFNSSQAAVHVGDVAAIKNASSQQWELAVLRWANMNELNQLDVGLELIAPAITTAIARIDTQAQETEVLLLPELPALKRPKSIVIPSEMATLNSKITVDTGDHTYRSIKLSALIEHTEMFERYEYA